MLQMQMHDRIIERRRRVKHHRPERGVLAPLPHLLLATAGDAQGVQGRRPGGVFTQGFRRDSKSPWGRRVGFEGGPVLHLQRRRQRGAERFLLEIDLLLRAFQSGAQGVDLGFQRLLPVAGHLQLLGDGFPIRGRQLQTLEGLIQPRHIGMTNTAAQ